MSSGTTGLRHAVNAARHALSRGQPVDVLAALDAASNGATRGTEDAWYLRAAALLMLGLPAESERVALSGARSFSGSAALPFLRSLARLALDDAVGARTALDSALQRRPSDPLLVVQQAVISAREGGLVHAAAIVSDASARGASDAIVAYGRDALELERIRTLRGATTGAEGSHRGSGVTAPIELGLQLLDASRDPVGSAAGARLERADYMMDVFPTSHRDGVDAINAIDDVSEIGTKARGVRAKQSLQQVRVPRTDVPVEPLTTTGSNSQRATRAGAAATPAGAAVNATPTSESPNGRAVEIAAVLLIVGGAVAAAAGYAAAAVAFGVGVAWLAVRRAAADGSRAGRSR